MRKWHRAKELCYNCDEQYSFGHQCKKLFWVELDDSEDSILDSGEKTVGDPAIPLHAISGIQTSQTMQLLAEIERCPITGSTHNFINSMAV